MINNPLHKNNNNFNAIGALFLRIAEMRKIKIQINPSVWRGWYKWWRRPALKAPPVGLLLLTLQPKGSAVITRGTYFSSEYSLPIAAITNYTNLVAANTFLFSFDLYIRSLTWVSLDYNQGDVRTVLLLETLGENPFPFLVWLWEAAYFLMVPSCIFKASEVTASNLSLWPLLPVWHTSTCT